MTTISLQELRLDPDALLDRIEAGEHVLVVRDGRPVAELRPVRLTEAMNNVVDEVGSGVDEFSQRAARRVLERTSR